MARFNTGSHKAKAPVAFATSPIASVSGPSNTRTFEGAMGWTRKPQAELFLRATGAFHGGEGSFYENGKERDDRLRRLVAEAALIDSQWVVDFATWLRGPGNMRTASLMIAVDFVRARLNDHKVFGTDTAGLNRKIIDAVCQRADEPGEILSIWTAWYGRKIPKPVKRGVADAVRRLYNEYALLKYDTSSHSYRFGDVLNLTHASPDPGKSWQGDLFQYALDRRHHPETAVVPDSLLRIKRNQVLRAGSNPELWLDADLLRNAAMTWEDALSAVGGKVLNKAKLWEALIPSMGIMALVRNLRNFDQAGVSDKVAQQVIDKLQDPDIIAKSRMFPFRFLAAFRAAGDSLRWAYPLEKALNLSLGNVPSLGGRTLILVDRSPSMFPSYYDTGKSDISRADQAAVFGSALALRAEKATLVEFGGTSNVIPAPKGSSVLKLVEAFGQIGYTDIGRALREHFDGHDRVVIITDEQTKAGYVASLETPITSASMYGYNRPREVALTDLVPVDTPVFLWNLAGYTASAAQTGSNAHFSLGGLTDKAFLLIPQLEAGVQGTWPWETGAVSSN